MTRNTKEYLKQYYLKHKDEASKNSKEYYQQHKEEIKARVKNYVNENRDKIREYSKKRYKEHRSEVLEKRKIYSENHKEELREYRRRTKEQRAEKWKEYHEENRDKLIQKGRERYKNNGIEKAKKWRKSPRYKEYYNETKEHIKKRSKQYYENNKEHCKKRLKEYHKKVMDSLGKTEHEETCSICGNKFITRHTMKKTCSRECHKKMDLHYRKKWYEENKEHCISQQKRYKQTERGKEIGKRTRAKRRRNKKWIPILPNIFPSDIHVDWHHIDGMFFVAPLPKHLHKATGSKDIKKHINNANDWIEFYYGINPVSILKEDVSCEDVQIVEDGLKTNEQ